MQAKFFVRLIIYPLTLYSAFRNYSLIQTTMGGDTFALVAGLFALAALDGGVIIWSEIAFRIDSDTQDKIAKSMVILDLVGALLGVIADTMLYVDKAAYLTTITTVSIYAIPVVIFLNLGAGFAYALADPENAIKAEEKRLDRDARYKEKLAELEHVAARREAEAARMRLETTAIRNKTTAALLGLDDSEPSQNGKQLSRAMAMDGQPPKAGKRQA